MNLVEFLTQNAVATIAVLTPIVLGLVAIFKLFVDNSKYSPLASLVFGAILGFFFGGFTMSYDILLGIIAGLAASGLYSGVKRVSE